jgi:hypothetical protein
MFLDFVQSSVSKNTDILETGSVPSSGKMIGAPTLLGPLERASLKSLNSISQQK